jgi:hypothetical protein
VLVNIASQFNYIILHFHFVPHFYCFCSNSGFGLSVTFLPSISPDNRELAVFSICFCPPEFSPNKWLPQLTGDPINWNPLYMDSEHGWCQSDNALHLNGTMGG